jgi:hypothetical protein
MSAMRANENDRNADIRFDQFVLQFKTTDPWKSHVKDKATGTIMGLALQELLRCRDRLRLQSHASQHALHRSAHTCIIVDNKDQRSC